MFDLWEKGDIVGARLVNSRMLESFAFETGDDAPNPIPTKAMMRHLGIAGRPGPAADGRRAGVRRRAWRQKCWPTCNAGGMRSPNALTRRSVPLRPTDAVR